MKQDSSNDKFEILEVGENPMQQVTSQMQNTQYQRENKEFSCINGAMGKVVCLDYDSNDNPFFKYGTGCLIGKDTVLIPTNTLFSQRTNKIHQYIYFIPNQYLQQGYDFNKDKKIKISNYYIHPKYFNQRNQTHSVYDVAICQLDRKDIQNLNFQYGSAQIGFSYDYDERNQQSKQLMICKYSEHNEEDRHILQTKKSNIIQKNKQKKLITYKDITEIEDIGRQQDAFIFNKVNKYNNWQYELIGIHKGVKQQEDSFGFLLSQYFNQQNLLSYEIKEYKQINFSQLMKKSFKNLLQLFIINKKFFKEQNDNLNLRVNSKTVQVNRKQNDKLKLADHFLKQKNQLTSQINRLNNKIEQLSLNYNDTQSQITRLNTIINQLQNNAHQYQSQKINKQQEIDKLKKKNQQLSQINHGQLINKQGLKKKNQLIEELKKQNSNLKQTQLKLRQQINIKNTKIIDLQLQIEEDKVKTQRFYQQNDNEKEEYKGKIKQLINNIEQLNKLVDLQKDNFNTKLHNLQQQKKNNLKEVQKLREQLRKENENIQILNRQKQQLIRDNENIRKDNQTLRSENQQLVQEMGNLTNKIIRLQRQSKQNITMIQKLYDENQKIKKQSQTNLLQLRNSQQQLSHAQSLFIREFSSRLDSMQRQRDLRKQQSRQYQQQYQVRNNNYTRMVRQQPNQQYQQQNQHYMVRQIRIEDQQQELIIQNPSIAQTNSNIPNIRLSNAQSILKKPSINQSNNRSQLHHCQTILQNQRHNSNHPPDKQNYQHQLQQQQKCSIFQSISIILFSVIFQIFSRKSSFKKKFDKKVLQIKILYQQEIKSIHNLKNPKKYLQKVYKQNKKFITSNYGQNSVQRIKDAQKKHQVTLTQNGYSLYLENIQWNHSEFFQYNWVNLEFLRLSEFKIHQQEWGEFCEYAKKFLPNLKALRVKLDHEVEIIESDLLNFWSIERIWIERRITGDQPEHSNKSKQQIKNFIENKRKDHNIIVRVDFLVL